MGYNEQSSPTLLGDSPPKVLIFDWDDTICPSSFVDQFQVERFKDLPVHVQRSFNEVAKSAEKCLDEASKYGEVIIITNSDEGWVKFSCDRYVPRLWPVVEQYRIVSARTRYERFYPGQPLCWKAAAFAHEVNELYQSCSKSSSSIEDVDMSVASTDVSSSSEDSAPSFGLRRLSSSSSSSTSSTGRREVISFGDSMEERTAVRIVADQLAAIPKSVMFIQSPTPLQIIGQLEMLSAHMKYICNHRSNLDLEISPQQAERSAEQYMKRSRATALASTTTSHNPFVNDMRMVLQRTPSESSEGVAATSQG